MPKIFHACSTNGACYTPLQTLQLQCALLRHLGCLPTSPLLYDFLPWCPTVVPICIKIYTCARGAAIDLHCGRRNKYNCKQYYRGPIVQGVPHEKKHACRLVFLKFLANFHIFLITMLLHSTV